MNRIWPRSLEAPALTGTARDALVLLPTAALTAYWALSTIFSGAYFPSAWYPAAIIVVVICPVLLAAGWRLPVGGTRAALALLGAFVAWTALSIFWADAGGHALEATNKLLLAFASAFLFAITPWNQRRALALLVLLVSGVAVASIATLLGTAYSSNPASSFIEQRYAAPLGYAGASAAFAALAIWPALALSLRGPLPAWLRAPMLAVAIVQGELALLPQSRGVIIGLALSAVAFLALAPSRFWALLRLLVAIAITALTIGPVLHVYTVANDGGAVAGPLHDAVASLAFAAVLGLVAGIALAAGEARLPEPPGGRAFRRVRAPALAVGLAAAALLCIVFSSSIAHGVSDRWDAFRAGHVERSESDSHLTSLGDPERYDYWRVALSATAESPIDGIGAGNFQDAYTVKRESEKHSRYAHSIWMRVLSETGIVGLVLLLAALATGIFAVARGRARAAGRERLLIAGALPVTLLVFGHASVDWVEEFPPILGAAVGLLFLAGRLVDRPPAGPPRHQGAGLVAGLAVTGIALACLVPAYLSLRFIDRAEAAWATDPRAAYRDLDRAAYLNPLSSGPDVLRGEIAAARDEDRFAVRSFERAIGREDNWYPHFQLATLASENGHRREALNQMSKALRLNPVDPLLHDAVEELKEQRRLSLAGVKSQIRQEAEKRFYHLRPPEHSQR